uniref:Uncharacterized protein n=1 Tax=Romanomermis culicivorax TaxID=13658 RepID=A0A915IYR7_ROMCU
MCTLKVYSAYDKIEHVKSIRIPPFRLKTTLLMVLVVVSGSVIMLIVQLLIEQAERNMGRCLNKIKLKW